MLRIGEVRRTVHLIDVVRVLVGPPVQLGDGVTTPIEAIVLRNWLKWLMIRRAAKDDCPSPLP